MKPTASFLLLLSMALLLVACSGDPPASAFSSSPEASAVVETPEPTQGPLPIELTREPVRWVTTPVLDLASGTELARPFEEYLRETGQPADPQPVWRLNIVEGIGDAVELHKSPRLLNAVTWDSPRSLRVEFQTVRSANVPALGETRVFRWSGELQFDLSRRSFSEQIDPLPRAFAAFGRPPNAFLPFPIIELSASGKELLLFMRQGGPPTQGARFLADVLLVSESGEGRRLEGAPELTNISWGPDDKVLAGMRATGPTGPNGPLPYTLVLIPTRDGDSIQVANVAASTIERRYPEGPEGHRVAFVARGQGTDQHYLSIYDAETGRIRLLGIAAPGPMIWPSGQDRVLVGDRLFDAKTGASEPGSYIDLFPAARAQYASPSGRLVASLAEPQLGPVRDPACAGLPYRLSLTDKQTGATKTLLECATGTSGNVQWLSESKLFGAFSRCWACDAPGQRIWLLDVERGTSQSLTNGLEDWTFAIPSPDKTRLVVGGDRLRVYSADGALLRDYGPPPEGYRYLSASWATDGSAFAYILHPTSYHIGV